VCDATCRVLADEALADEDGIRLQVEWCRAVCLEAAHACDRHPGAEETALTCRRCARACTAFLQTLADVPR
jgi:hypothetical protein